MLEHKTYSDIVIQPVIECFNPLTGNLLVAGPIYPDFEKQGYSRYVRKDGPVDRCPPTPPAATVELLDEDFIYGGHLKHHFGHFITECIHRILPSVQVYPTMRIIFVDRPGSTQKPLRSFIIDIFTYLPRHKQAGVNHR